MKKSFRRKSGNNHRLHVRSHSVSESIFTETTADSTSSSQLIRSPSSLSDYVRSAPCSPPLGNISNISPSTPHDTQTVIHQVTPTGVEAKYGSLRNKSTLNNRKSVNDNSWPPPFDDTIHNLPTLPLNFQDIMETVQHTGQILVRAITWNQQGQSLPSIEDLIEKLVSYRMYHVFAIGTQECERSIQNSILLPEKEKWENLLSCSLGREYELLRSHSLQGSHLVVYIHKAIRFLVSNHQSHAVPTGIGDRLGNKGGIGISVSIANVSFCFITAHLAAHQNQTQRRLEEFQKISCELARELGPKGHCRRASELFPSLSLFDISPTKKENIHDRSFLHHESFSLSSSEENMEDMTTATTTINPNNPPATPPTYMQSLMCGAASNCLCNTDTLNSRAVRNPLVDAFDFVIWAADFNFRINGTRESVEQSILTYHHSYLIDNDQLSMMLPIDPTFRGLIEGPLTFRPTYKYDLYSDMYDTSYKRRIPAWTDRILYKECDNLQLLSYYCANNIKHSDHRPVYATFQCSIVKKHARKKKTHRRPSRLYDTDNMSTISQGSGMSGLSSFFLDMENINPMWTSERHTEVCTIT